MRFPGRTVRNATLQDRASVLELCLKRDYPHSTFLGKDQMKKVVSGHLAAFFGSSEHSLKLVAKVLEEQEQIVGFLLLEVNEQESITKQSQTVICDYHAADADQFHQLVRSALEVASENKDEYLIVSNYEDFSARVCWLEEVGFKQEILRVAKVVSPSHQAAEHPNFRIRKATDNDMLFIMRLVADHSPMYCPANRGVDKELVQRGFLQAYTSITPRNKKRVPLILEDKRCKDLAGYIILEPGRVFGEGGALTLYIYDIAIAPEITDKGLSRYLCAGGERLLAQMGGGVLFGDISADNRLAVGAQKGLGFSLDSTRWGRPVVNVV